MHVVSFYGTQSQLSAAFLFPQLNEPASQKFSLPFPLTTAPLLIPGRSFRDANFSVANLLSLFTGTCLCQLKFSPKGVGIAPRVGSCLSTLPLAKAQMGLGVGLLSLGSSQFNA